MIDLSMEMRYKRMQSSCESGCWLQPPADFGGCPSRVPMVRIDANHMHLPAVEKGRAFHRIIGAITAAYEMSYWS